MNRHELKRKRFQRRKKHVRKNVRGSDERPRMTVTRSLNNIYVQLIDDDLGKTVLSASTIDAQLRDQIKPDMTNLDKSKLVGQEIAKRALEAKIKRVAFDRNGFLYHGRIKALADAARKAGLEF